MRVAERTGQPRHTNKLLVSRKNVRYVPVIVTPPTRYNLCVILEYAKVDVDAPQPERVLNARDATCVVIGAIVGVGIFFTPARTAQLAGSGALMLVAWAIAGTIALCGALTFAELGGMYHASGAQYEILRDAYGPFPAFLFVFCNSTASLAGCIGIIAVVCARNLAIAVGSDWSTATILAISVALIFVLTIANIVGAVWGARIQNLTVYAKVLALILIALLAIALGREDVATPVIPKAGGTASLGGVAGVLAALVPAMFSFGGWQQALWISGEVRDPQRNLPRAIVGGVLVVIAVYLLANWSYLRLLGPTGVAGSSAVAADAVAAIYPSLGRRAIAGAVAISAFGVLNSQLLAGPRLLYRMAGDGRFFRPFASLDGRFGTPIPAILLIAVISLVILLTVGPERADTLVLTGIMFIDLSFFVLTGAALMVLRRKRADVERPVRVPGYPVVPMLFVTGEFAALVGAYLDPKVRAAAIIGAIWIAGAALLYVVRFRRVEN